MIPLIILSVLQARVEIPSSIQENAAQEKEGCLGGLFWFGVKIGVLLLLVVAVVFLGYYAWALTFDLRTISDMRQRSAVYDKDGKFYSRLAGENRIVVPFDKISNDFVNALLAREDTRFYYHHGIDPLGITRAVVRNFLGGFRLKEGASTLTQQLARNSFPLGGKNFHRKMIEAALSYRIETELTKEQILEAYMNRIYFGSGYYGVETASQAYFGKPASRMTVAEAALLAGLIRSPNRFSPFNDPEKATRERNTVLGRMLKLGYIDKSQYQTALATKVASGPGLALLRKRTGRWIPSYAISNSSSTRISSTKAVSRFTPRSTATCKKPLRAR